LDISVFVAPTMAIDQVYSCMGHPCATSQAARHPLSAAVHMDFDPSQNRTCLHPRANTLKSSTPPGQHAEIIFSIGRLRPRPISGSFLAGIFPEPTPGLKWVTVTKLTVTKAVLRHIFVKTSHYENQFFFKNFFLKIVTYLPGTSTNVKMSSHRHIIFCFWGWL